MGHAYRITPYYSAHGPSSLRLGTRAPHSGVHIVMDGDALCASGDRWIYSQRSRTWGDRNDRVPSTSQIPSRRDAAGRPGRTQRG